MKRFALTLPIFIGSLMMNPIKGDFLVDGVLTKTAESNKNTCISYVPKIGSVKEGEDINIDSDKFQITEDKRLILYGNVQLDFVDGLLSCLLYTSPSPRDATLSRMPSSA